MHKLYSISYIIRQVAQCLPNSCRNIFSSASFQKPIASGQIFLFVLALMMQASITMHAQNRTFYEGFNTTPQGELPEGWSAWQNGGGSAPQVVWWIEKFNPLGAEKYIISNPEGGRAGMIDEDWLITPQITPAAGDHLMFNTRRSFFLTGDLFHIRISTTTNDAPEAFTETLRTFTEAELPQSYDPVSGKIRIDLADYVGIPIHIAFVHAADVGEEGTSGIWLIDEVEVRPIQAAYVENSYFRQATSPPQPPLKLGEVTAPASVSFVVNGDHSTVNLSSITLGTEGTTDLSLIEEISIYYTDTEYIVIESIINGEIPLFGSASAPGALVEITGNMELDLGKLHYFWVVYTLDESRQLTFPYPKLDLTFEKFVANGEEFIPETRTFFGALDVVPPVVVNDHLADAIEITSASGRYGSSTLPATYEEDFDKLAYCQTQGFEEVHSVWWYYVAPADGVITADLSESGFNTMIAFFDENFVIQACNDDINDRQQQSRISDFPVKKGKKIYIRVSDFGGCCGTEYRNSGVVVMDFTFQKPVGIEDEDRIVDISALYPNPTSSKASLDVNVRKPGEVLLDVRDLMGRNVLTQTERFSSPGKHTVIVDATTLTSGTYVVHVRGGGAETSWKLVVAK